jgi:glycosyltransferase involved in cell wall biosynthesis
LLCILIIINNIRLIFSLYYLTPKRVGLKQVFNLFKTRYNIGDVVQLMQTIENIVSIIMPVYNCENVLQKSIGSVLNQSYTDIELILIDDGSTDKSGEICDSYSAKDNRVTVIHQENSGPSKARNTGLKIASGKYIMFIDSDDLYDVNIVRNLLFRIEDDGADLGICNYTNYYENRKKAPNNKVYDICLDSKLDIAEYLEYMIKNNIFKQLWNKIYVSQIIKENQIFMDETLDMGEDYLFNLNYVQVINKINITNQHLYFYYINDSGLTSKYRKNDFELGVKGINELKKFYDNASYFSTPIITFRYIILANRCIINLHDKKNIQTFRQNLQTIKTILNHEDISKALRNVKPANKTEQMLTFILKLRSPLIIYIITFFIKLIKSR